MKKILPYISLVLYIITCFTLSTSAYAEQTIRIGYYPLPPFQEKNEFDEYCGYGFEYYSELAQHGNFQYEFIETDINTCLEMLKNGEIDLIGGIPKSFKYEQEYDYSSLPIINTHYELYTLQSNEKYTPTNYTTFNDARIGILSSTEELFNQYISDKSFSYTCSYYNSQDELETACLSKEIDMIFSSNLKNTHIFKTIDTLNSSIPVYLAVQKGNPLIHQINDAMKTMNSVYPTFSYDLYSKYTKNGTSFKPEFTDEELEYINSHPTIRIVYNPFFAPIEHYDSDSKAYIGITSELFSVLEEYSGLRFSYVQTSNFADSLRFLTSDRADIITSIIQDYHLSNEYNVKLTPPFLHSDVVVVSKRNHNINNPIIALPRNHFTTTKVERDNPTATIIYYDTIEECLKAISTGKADISYMNEYVANYYLSLIEHNSLAISSISNYEENLCIGISKNTDPLLFSIINKSLSCISSQDMNDIVTRNMLSKEKYNIKDLIYANPLVSILVILVIAVVTLCIIYYKMASANKTNLIFRQTNDELELKNELFRSSMKHIKCDIMEYDLINRVLYLYNRDTGNKLILPTHDAKEMLKHKKETTYPSFLSFLAGLKGRLSSGENPVIEVLEGMRNDTEPCFGKLMATAVYNSDNMLTKAICSIEDVTDSIGEQRQLQKKLNIALKTAYDETFEVDIKNDTIKVLFSNSAKSKKKLSEIPYSEHLTNFAKSYIPADQNDIFLQTLAPQNLKRIVLTGNSSLYFECDIWSPTYSTYRRSSYSIILEDGSNHKFFVLTKDIDTQVKERQLLIDRSQRDSLTGVYNKISFFEFSTNYINTTSDENYAIIFIDLDNFKKLNDTHGHIKGDEAIKDTAEKLQTLFSTSDIISRFGGDEFCILAKNIPEKILKSKLASIVESMRRIYDENNRPVKITASIGAAKGKQGLTFEQLLDQADKALYKAKNSGKNTYVIYSDSLQLDDYVGRSE